MSTAVNYVTDSTATILVTDATVTATTVVSTELDYATTSTNTVTVTDSTVTAITTDSTETDFVTVTTATVIVPDSTSTDVITTATITALVTDTVQSTVVATVTQVAVSTVTPTCANAQPTFALQLVGGAYNGQYLRSTPFSGQGVDIATAGSTIVAASAYTLTGTVLTDSTGYTLATPISTAFTYAEFRPATQIASGADLPFVCTVTNGHLTCASGAVTQFGICNISGPIAVLTRPGYYPSGYGCTNVVLNVVPLCVAQT